jgi:leader peptidase (prepilin peptidase)/N-methyltransferase
MMMSSCQNYELAIIAMLIGLIAGSFISMLSWRLPRTNSISQTLSLNTRSKCTNCQNTLNAWQLIPIYGWLRQKGQCHFCGQPISKRYPLIELISCILTGTIVFIYGVNWSSTLILLLFYGLITISVIDFEHQIIPDQLSLSLLWLGLIFNPLIGLTSLQLAVFGAAIGYLSLWLLYQLHKRLTGKEGMGYGDFKLFAALGAWLGALQLTNIILIAAASALIYALLMKLFGKIHLSAAIPFGPFLALGGICCVIFIGI